MTRWPFTLLMILTVLLSSTGCPADELVDDDDVSGDDDGSP
ncbi:MAG: hypothetical protein QGH45_20525 [Myxococcota bacterium]|jgi:hypothetical protein|nr:hypothetical protein [Myxococcota bacterium]